MTTQLQQDLERAVIDYLQIEVIRYEDQPWEYIHKGVKHTLDFGICVGWVLDDMMDNEKHGKCLITEEEFIACSALVNQEHSEYIFTDSTKDDCLKLALEIIPKYVRDNLMLALTLYKLSMGEDNCDFDNFLVNNIYGEFDITKELIYRHSGFSELMELGFVELNDDAVDSIIRLTFPGIPLAPVLNVYDHTSDFISSDDFSEIETLNGDPFELFKKQFTEQLAFNEFIPTQIKELGHSYLKIWEYLRDNQEKWFTANQLAERFECTPQWIRDAVGTMRKQGIDIFGHTRKGYILRTSVVDQLFAENQAK